MKNRDPASWIDKESFAAWLGGNEPSREPLLRFYDKAAQKRNATALSVNVLAILMLPGFLGYRRLWASWTALTAVICAAVVAESWFRYQIPLSAFLGPLLAMGFLANGLALATANRQYWALKGTGSSSVEIREALAGRARPSISLAIGAVVAHFGLIFAASWIASALTRHHVPVAVLG